jgi:hypothetical protein
MDGVLKKRAPRIVNSAQILVHAPSARITLTWIILEVASPVALPNTSTTNISSVDIVRRTAKLARVLISAWPAKILFSWMGKANARPARKALNLT